MKLINQTEFNKLTAAEKRVAIAKDVLKRVKSKKIKPTQGNLIGFESEGGKWDDSAQGLINKQKCEACAKGALLCSWIGNFNQFSIGDTLETEAGIDKNWPKGLVKLFGKDALDSMEYNFEGAQFYWNSSVAIGRGRNEKYENNLPGIMRNIIRNNGTFNPKN